jgi:hypothetical protein
VSLRVGHLRRLTTKAGTLALALSPGALLAQPDREISPEDSMDEIAAEIAAKQTEGGPYSIELLDPLRALAVLQDENGNRIIGDALRERAIQVVRANYGLRSLEQAPLMEQRIYNEEERGNFERAWSLEKDLLALARHNPNDLRTVEIYRGVAEKRMTLLERYLGGSYQPQIVLGCYYSPRQDPDYGSCNAGSRTTAARTILAEAHRRYQDAINVLLRNGLHDGREIEALEQAIVLSSYEYSNYPAGRQSLRRSMAYTSLDTQAALPLLEHAIGIADWDLLFDYHPVAMKIYAESLEALASEGVDAAVTETLFEPELPVMLPSFLPNPLALRGEPNGADYIDVAFEVSKYGRGRKIDVLETTAAVRKTDIDELTRRIVRGRFRPRLLDGEFADTRAVVRYYLPASQ